MKTWSATVVVLFAASALAQAPHDHEHRFDDAEHWSDVFDDPQRDAWQKPHEVVEALALPADAVVADIGAGTGYFAVRLARMLPKGKVYAADVEPQMVRHLAARAKRDELANMVAVQSDLDDARLPQTVDMALFVDVFHHIDGRESYFRRLKNSLRAGGRVAIVDFRRDSAIGPPPRARISADHVKRQLAAAGYTLEAEHDFLPNQYFLVFRARN